MNSGSISFTDGLITLGVAGAIITALLAGFNFYIGNVPLGVKMVLIFGIILAGTIGVAFLFPADKTTK